MEIQEGMGMPDMQGGSEPRVVAEEAGRADDSLPVRPLDEEGAVEEAAPEATVPCEYWCGVAGSGKTYYWRERIAADPTEGVLAATTGIAAVNLGTITLNSLLRYFDTDSLRDAYLNGSLGRRLRELREQYRRIVIDEVSMMDGEQLSLLVRAALDANSYKSDRPPLGLTLVGDFAQLPPVKARWAFESDEWHRFDGQTTRLTKVWRQDAGPFLNALNLTRFGAGDAAVQVLTQEGLEWHTSLDIAYDGTTIVSKNDQVDRYNSLALSRLSGAPISLVNRRWGRQRGEWKQVPDRVALKEGAYVMLLSNSYDEDGALEYANGDCGHVVRYNGYDVTVRLVRSGEEVTVSRVCRSHGPKDKPSGWTKGVGATGDGEWCPRPHWQSKKKCYAEGQVEWWPLRLAYASTVHKSQGLSLDRAQIDIRDQFFGQPAMLYVALSRCRTMQGLRVVGQPERFVRQCKVDERVRPWL